MVGVLFVLVGWLMSRAIDACVEWLPRGGGASIDVWSRCGACRGRARVVELIPILGFAITRGRCGICGARLPWREPTIELLTPALFALVWMRYDLTWESLVAAAYASLFIVVLFIDVEHRVIPNRIVYPAALLAVAISPLWPELGLTRALIGGVVGFLVMLVPCLLGGMGGGDVKLAGLIGVMVGFPLVFVALVISMTAGGLTAAALLATRRKGRKDAIAYGPFLAVAGLVTLLYGQPLWSWYTQGLS